MIVFYATPDNVYFVDGQFINEGKEEKPRFSKISNALSFC